MTLWCRCQYNEREKGVKGGSEGDREGAREIEREARDGRDKD
jgi:hypothetical protein